MSLVYILKSQVEKMRREVAEKQNRHWRAFLAAAEETVSDHIRAKQAEIEAIGRLNQSLENHVATLSLQNQVWRELARSNEAAARVLRANLAQAAEPAASSTGSSDSAADRRCRVCDSAESCVLILPCRHLCLCGSCGACVDVCPVCDSDKTVTINVNMS